MPGREHLFLSMRDGVRLHATLYLPDGVGPWPALLEALPYRKDDLTARYRPEYERFAGHGYAVLRVDVRGTGTSEGPALDEYPPVEQDDLNEVIAWLASRPWSNGNVGMFGTSYSGFNSVQVAMTRPEALKAIVSIFATDDRYTYDDVHYFGGALKALDLCDYPVMMAAMNALPPVPSLFGDGWRGEWERRVHDNEPWLLRWLEEQDYSAYWKHGSLREEYSSIGAATMIVAGWADGYWKDVTNVFERLECPKRLLQGPWAHASTETSLPGPNIDLVPEMIRWWDRWLKDEDNGIDREPPIVLYARRSTPPAADLREVRGEWRFEPGWPLERSRETALALAAAERAGAAAGGRDDLEVRGDVGWTAWISCAGHLPYGQPLDQRPDEPFSLGYVWEPLAEELEILGRPRFDVTVTADRPVAFLSAKLVDVFPDGTSALAGRGFLNLTHRDSHERPEPLEPSVPTRVSLPFLLTSWTFDAGHRLRLDVAGTDWPNVWTPPDPVTLSIDVRDAMLVLPTLEGPTPVIERPRLSPPTLEARQEIYEPRSPVAAPTPSRGRERPDGIDWKVEHDVLEHRTTATSASWGTSAGEADIPETFERYGGVVSVSTTDAADARVDARSVIRIAYPEATVESEARYSVVSDAKSYRVEIQLDVGENGDPRWSRRWERSIPRRLQ
jgi:putative CocE/NonD family hydrolase